MGQIHQLIPATTFETDRQCGIPEKHWAGYTLVGLAPFVAELRKIHAEKALGDLGGRISVDFSSVKTAQAQSAKWKK